jgi:ribonuclease-3
LARGIRGVTARAPDDQLRERLGHAFADPKLLETALTHASAAFEQDGSRGNERLEFLGDAVLGLVVARLLYESHPEWREGELTRARAALVNGQVLARQARELGLVDYLVLGRTERRSGGAEKERVLANLFEAVIGALYLDGGIEPVRALVSRCFGPALLDEATLQRDPKTRFQEWAHATLQDTPRYSPVQDTGVENAEDRFTVAVRVGEERWGTGTGRTKQAAERAAAAAALARVEGAGG